MNICVIGGGMHPGKFGTDFCDRARQEGHNVYVLSHQYYPECNDRHLWADFSDVNNVVSTFNQLVSTLDHIDIFVYNTKASQFGTPEQFKSTTDLDLLDWNYTLIGDALIPHLLCIQALKKMSSRSKIVFLVSGLALTFNRTTDTEYVTYATGKTAQAFLMMAFAKHNDRGATATAVSPHFDYDNPRDYKIIFNNVYHYIMNIDSEQNGKIREFYEPVQYPFLARLP